MSAGDWLGAVFVILLAGSFAAAAAVVIKYMIFYRRDMRRHQDTLKKYREQLWTDHDDWY